MFFGLQYFLKKYLVGKQVKDIWEIQEMADFLNVHMGSTDLINASGWHHILDDHYGWLPLRIRAVPEGTYVPPSNALMTVENTCPKCFWLTNYMETILSQIWYPTTVASNDFAAKKILRDHAALTGADPFVDFKLHDFGYRGSTSPESAAIGCAAHMVNFQGTDTIGGLLLLKNYYHADTPAGFSIPAAEHSTITSWGKDHEVDAFRNMLEQYPNGLVAVVSDSYDIFNACENLWGKELHDSIVNRNGTLVVRPDSGYPPSIVVQVLNTLGQAFGYTHTDKGYHLLPPYIRVIQGDGIDQEMMTAILYAMTEANWSTDNITFGSGGGLLQKVNRDTYRFAFKCSEVIVDGERRDVSKDPITDHGKKSKAGRFSLIEGESGHFETVPYDESLGDNDLLVPVFENGKLLVDYTFDEVRARANTYL
jgi:nicotinamide phosphoribosyltransferase